MRYAVATLAGMALFAGAAPAQQAQGWAGKLFKGATEHDFGTVPKGTLLHHRFTLTNIYAVPLQLPQSLRISCGCVTAAPSAQVLQPHQTATIDVLMNTRAFSGPKTVYVYVDVGGQYASTAVLKVTGNSRTDVVLNPGQVNFGVVPQGQTPEQSVNVEYAGPLDWRITGRVESDAPVDVTMQELFRQPGKVGVRIGVKLKPDAPAGVMRHELQLQTNDPAGPLLPLLVEGSVQAPLAVAPDAVAFRTTVGGVESRKVVIRGTGKPFRVLQAEGQGDGVTVELPPVAREVQIVTVKFQPTKPGEVRRQIVFRTDLDRSPVAAVLVEGVGELKPPAPN